MRTAGATEHGAKQRAKVPALVGFAAAILAVLFINLRLEPSHRLSLLYALPILLAAHRLPPAKTLAVALLGVGSDLLGVTLARPPLELWLYSFLGMVGIAYLAVLLSAQRQKTARQAQEAEAARQALQVFLGMVAHDLASPLTAIVGHAQLLRRRLSPSDPAQSSASAIDHSAQQMRRLVSDLHAAAAIGAGSFAIERRDADLAAVIRAVVGQQQASASNHCISYRAPERLEGTWDPQRLGQVAANLISNAVKYSPPDSTVRVELSIAGDMARFSVADEGPGMSPEEQQALFRPFSRLARNRSIPGTGLGLYIADTITRAHGGRITVESAPGNGSIFIVTLPRRPVP